MAKVRLRGCRDPDTVAEGRMGFEIMGKVLFNKKPHSRSALLQTLLPSLTRRFALHGDPKKFACLLCVSLPLSKARRLEASCAILRCEGWPYTKVWRASGVMAVTDIPLRS